MSCIACSLGYYTPLGMTQCFKRDRGSYSDRVGQDACTACPPSRAEWKSASLVTFILTWRSRDAQPAISALPDTGRRRVAQRMLPSVFRFAGQAQSAPQALSPAACVERDCTRRRVVSHNASNVLREPTQLQQPPMSQSTIPVCHTAYNGRPSPICPSVT